MSKKEIEKENDLYFIGTNGQYRFVKSLLENKEIFMESLPSLKPAHFTDSALKRIVKEIKARYETTGDITTISDLEFILKGCEEKEVPILKAAYKKLIEEDFQGQDIATEKCLEFIKRKEAINILQNGLESFKNSGFSRERLERVVEYLQNIERNASCNEVSADDIMDEVLNETRVIKVNTGIPQLDEKMRGGLSMGSLGLLIAGTGVGKTTVGSILCCNAALHGYNVLHIFFEDSKTDIGKKYYAHLTNKYTYDFNNEADKQAMKDLIYNSHPRAKEALKEHIKLIRMPNGTTTVEDIISTVNRLITLQNWKPEMIFIDYIGCMQTTSNETLKMQNECQAYERLTKRLESFASDYNIAVWIAQQTNRAGMIADTANQRMGNIQGSFRVTQPCSAILYLDRSKNNLNPNDKDLANLYLDKCRGGEPSEWENIYLNNGTCQIDLKEQSYLVDELTFKIEE